MKNMQYPHVVKFSGGRSSGMMLMKMLQSGELDPKRGDVIIFNNTSAEHLETYSFTKKMKAFAEKQGIPFFWIEFQTYEDSGSKYMWTRKPTYRLVNDEPYSTENPDGYHYKGEVFEEMISWRSYLPNLLQRVCTTTMKIFVTNAFLSDWFAQKQGIKHLGHRSVKSLITDEDVWRTHCMANGSTPKEVLLEKKKYVRSRPTYRKKAIWRDFTTTEIVIDNKILNESTFGGVASLYGNRAIDYVSLIGIRSDERRRLSKIMARIDAASEEVSNSSSFFKQPVNEIARAPLIESNISKEDVLQFWESQEFTLELDDNANLSNCVYCFLKGSERLMSIAQSELIATTSNQSKDETTPQNIAWWIDIEKRYARNMKRENRKSTSKKEVTNIGFFGATDRYIYSDIKDKALTSPILDEKMLESAIPCECTD